MAHVLMDYASGRHPTGMHDLPLCVCFRVCVYMLEGTPFRVGVQATNRETEAMLGVT